MSAPLAMLACANKPLPLPSACRCEVVAELATAKLVPERRPSDVQRPQERDKLNVAYAHLLYNQRCPVALLQLHVTAPGLAAALALNLGEPVLAPIVEADGSLGRCLTTSAWVSCGCARGLSGQIHRLLDLLEKRL